MGGMHLPAKKHPGLRHRSWKRQGRIVEEAQPCRHLDFKLLVSGTTREYTSVVLGRAVCGSLLRQPQETNTGAPTTLQSKLKPAAQARRSWPSPDFISWPFLHDGLRSWKMPSSCCLRAIAFAVPLADMLFPILGMFGFFSILRVSTEAFPDHATQSTAARGFRIYFLHGLASLYV